MMDLRGAFDRFQKQARNREKNQLTERKLNFIKKADGTYVCIEAPLQIIQSQNCWLGVNISTDYKTRLCSDPNDAKILVLKNYRESYNALRKGA